MGQQGCRCSSVLPMECATSDTGVSIIAGAFWRTENLGGVQRLGEYT
jgi:hypothetical protein